MACVAWGLESVKPALVEKALGLMGGAEEIVFAVRPLYTFANQPNATFGCCADSPDTFVHAPDGSKLCKINLRTRRVVVLLDDPKGGIRDPRVHYGGEKILFSYRKGGTHYYHLCEIRCDGTGFRQLTFGEWDDIDPAYLPDGGIVFSSSRCRRFVPCQYFQVADLYRMDADGGNMLCLSANCVADDRPAVLPDGRIVYTRWEYVDRNAQQFRDLWTMNPDGTGQSLLFGPLRHESTYFAKCDAMPIPGTDKIVSVFSPALGQRENAGNVMIVDPQAGPDDWSAAKQISPEANLVWTWGNGFGDRGFRDPYPLSPNCFLVAGNKSLLVLDDNGNTQEFYRDNVTVHDPRVIRPQSREPILPSRLDLRKATGQLVLANVYHGRNMQGVKPGTIKKLLVLEELPKPISYRSNYELGGINNVSHTKGDMTLTLRRVLGEVPVETDGSASFEVPPLRALYFVALDEKGLSVKRMQSFTMVMPGETQGCVGCHESRTGTAGPAYSDVLLALKRAPSRLEPITGVPEVIDYSRAVQPVWDKHCVTCHSAEKHSGHVVLTGDHTEWFTQSYLALLAYNQVSYGGLGAMEGNRSPWGFGTAASPLMKKIDGHHNDVHLSELERDTVRLWIETSAAFSGTYAVNRHAETAVAGYIREYRPKLAALKKPAGPIIGNRCLSCHGDSTIAPFRNHREKGCVYLTRDFQMLFNLSHPEKSTILLAPLAKKAGGYEWCKGKDGKSIAVFRDTKDPDYQTLLQAIQTAKLQQEKLGRIDGPGFRPNEHYVYWMKRFGLLPESFDLAKDPINVYETDEAYWRSLWHRPSTNTTTAVSNQMAAGM